MAILIITCNLPELKIVRSDNSHIVNPIKSLNQSITPSYYD